MALKFACHANLKKPELDRLVALFHQVKKRYVKTDETWLAKWPRIRSALLPKIVMSWIWPH